MHNDPSTPANFQQTSGQAVCGAQCDGVEVGNQQDMAAASAGSLSGYQTPQFTARAVGSDTLSGLQEATKGSGMDV